MRKLIIDRKKWARVTATHSRPAGSSWLLNTAGGMCCLGFDAASLGAEKTEMLSVGYPSSKRPELPSSFTREEQLALGGINDRIGENAAITDSEQERLIAAKFAEKDVLVEFIN